MWDQQNPLGCCHALCPLDLRLTSKSIFSIMHSSSALTIARLCWELDFILCPAVFVGEVDEGKVSGFHNWIQFHFEERAGRVNYLGYLLPRGRWGFVLSSAVRLCFTPVLL